MLRKSHSRNLSEGRLASRPGCNHCTRILLAVGPGLIRAGLRAVLNGRNGTRVVGETGLVLEIVELVQSKDPDVLILDADICSAPRGKCCETLKTLHGIDPCLKVIVLCSDISPEQIGRAFKAGICGCITRECATDDVKEAIRKVMAGDHYFSPTITDATLAALDSAARRSDDPLLGLTCREREMLRLMANGHDIKGIASTCKVSDKAVYQWRKKVMGVLDIDETIKLQLFAEKHFGQHLQKP